MKGVTAVRRGALGVVAGLLLAAPGAPRAGAQVRFVVPARPGPARPGLPRELLPAPTPAEDAFVPRFEALAETRLLMEGMANANYRSLQRLLKQKPADVETWVFVRGQALLTAETGNLLLLRPPRSGGRDTWMRLAMGMRDQAGQVARAASARDYAASKAGLTGLTDACNRCHSTFRVPVRVGPEAEKGERSVSARVDE